MCKVLLHLLESWSLMHSLPPSRRLTTLPSLLGIGLGCMTALSSQVKAATRDQTMAPAQEKISATGKPKPITRRQATTPLRQKHVQQVPGGTETLIVTGTREIGKKARDSIAPIDVVSSRQLTSTGQPTLRDAMQLLLPSLTVPTGGFDAGALTDSISLRGLSSNETLILVNGHRRHTTANIYADSGPQQGTTPTDIDMIPLSAIDHIEVLRDGASAQYGSDAIAGVVNIILKKQDHGLTIRSNSGITSKGDGYQQGIFIDGGASFGEDRGFIHVSGDLVHQDHSFRSGPDSRTGTTINKILSQPEQTRESVAINAGYDITNTLQLYSTATYAHRHAEAFQNYRLPSSLASTPGYAAIYPDGYSPLQTLEENDFEITAGLKGRLAGWHWDLSSTYGRDFDNIGLKNDANKALPASVLQTTYNRVQGFNDTQWNNELNLNRKLNLSFWPHSINLAGGAGYRYEAYSIAEGSSASTYGGGTSLALAGTSPRSAGNSNRDVVSGYVDISTHLTKHWQLDMAGRYEHYTDVGNTQTGKISTRYDVSRRLAFRGTFSNGFHAPTLAQEHYSALTLSPTVARGLVAATSPGALASGAQRLKPEQSTNVEGGIIAEPFKGLHVTTDFYQIDLRGRILPGNNLYGVEAANILAANGITDLPANITNNNLSTQWFANVANTRTQGMDMTITYTTKLRHAGRINWDAAINLNRTRLRHQATRSDGTPVLNAPSRAYITTAYPRSKIIFGGTWVSPAHRWAVALHEIRYGQTTSALTYYRNNNTSTASTTNYLQFHNRPKWTTNLSVTYNINKIWSTTLGGNNIFAAFPSKVPHGNRYLGAAKYYLSTSQLGINGGYYYLDVSAHF